MTKLISVITKADQNAPLAVSYLSAAEYAASLLNRGCVIAVPTDTVYGLACLAQNKKAVKRLFQIKKHNNHKPIAICVGSVQEIPRYCKIDLSITPLLNDLLPGPVTLLLEALPYLNKDFDSPNKFSWCAHAISPIHNACCATL